MGVHTRSDVSIIGQYKMQTTVQNRPRPWPWPRPRPQSPF